ncbi:MAG: type II CAAX endopeptidase family protein [Candidatus Poribacteria bacterium]|nr:type II CAAX endopeptidase family protein [Candidatus Poribacteria bacterium]
MQDNPFETSRDLRGRSLVVRSILTLVVAIITNAILFRFSGSPLSMALFSVFLYGFFFLFNFRGLSRSGLSYDRLFGTFPAWCTLGRYSLWVVPLVISAIASTYVLYLPLSYVFPGFVKSWYLESSSVMIWQRGDNYILANAINYLTIVLIAPVMEEFFVRGILLTRWTAKWGVTRAILVSSIVFGLLHTNVIGGFCFAYVMAIFYIRTKSLFIPISLHILNNLSAWIMGYITMELDTPASYETISEFQESWWIGLIALVISVPCVILFCRHYLSKTDWRVPYLTEPPNSENDLYG